MHDIKVLLIIVTIFIISIRCRQYAILRQVEIRLKIEIEIQKINFRNYLTILPYYLTFCPMTLHIVVRCRGWTTPIIWLNSHPC